MTNTTQDLITKMIDDLNLNCDSSIEDFNHFIEELTELPILNKHNNNLIKFNNPYTKIAGQKTAKLVEIFRTNTKRLSPKFLEYDCLYERNGISEFTFIPIGFLIVLLFIGDQNIPFTTVRVYTPGDYKVYKSKLNTIFDIHIINP